MGQRKRNCLPWPGRQCFSGLSFPDSRGGAFGSDAVVFCLGAYTGEVLDAQIRKITADYTPSSSAFSAAAARRGFLFLSGSGAARQCEAGWPSPATSARAIRAVLESLVRRMVVRLRDGLLVLCQEY